MKWNYYSCYYPHLTGMVKSPLGNGQGDAESPWKNSVNPSFKIIGWS
jgi:hypothetical protein